MAGSARVVLVPTGDLAHSTIPLDAHFTRTGLARTDDDEEKLVMPKSMEPVNKMQKYVA